MLFNPSVQLVWVLVVLKPTPYLNPSQRLIKPSFKLASIKPAPVKPSFKPVSIKPAPVKPALSQLQFNKLLLNLFKFSLIQFNQLKLKMLGDVIGDVMLS
ncbi:hypothetical protein BFG52_13220 [Acinetobacter larvae]|uniref:Uncharacterized protein n=1 Tax=Acinetobacter larvae TaxID=1789224 RepID=A0A1B2M2H5_9GAMM|nr:hypothetical protein BFG52_13220 [Acinetobacter larvae]